MPTSHGTAQKEQHRIVVDGRALLRPYAAKRSEEEGKNIIDIGFRPLSNNFNKKPKTNNMYVSV